MVHRRNEEIDMRVREKRLNERSIRRRPNPFSLETDQNTGIVLVFLAQADCFTDVGFVAGEEVGDLAACFDLVMCQNTYRMR